ncbi:MAG: AmmeMemoRadiSam system protein A [Aeropyrum sp.]|nr:AmmeMemoRadiSam system protein A [Aeropyrum sp.]
MRIARARELGGPVDPQELSQLDGGLLVRLARASVKYFMESGRPPSLQDVGISIPSKLGRPGAAFVTIEERGSEGWELRGCIGLVRPIAPLAEAVVRAAVDAAFSDPRFPPLAPEELPESRFEVTVLGGLEELPKRPDLRLAEVKVGVHGLLVESPPNSGLLLPQVAVEEGWNEVMFLTWACIKAGLSGTCWLREDVRVYRFRARIWREIEPEGIIEERILEAVR